MRNKTSPPLLFFWGGDGGGGEGGGSSERRGEVRGEGEWEGGGNLISSWGVSTICHSYLELGGSESSLRLITLCLEVVRYIAGILSLLNFGLTHVN